MIGRSEKSIRDFVKKFLGRIVFLYFVQKKGWLGVKKGANWGTGDPMFLSNLFKSYKYKNEFYNKVISKIFFDYLSIERKDNDPIILDNFTNFIGDIDNWNILKISSTDRRFVWFECNNQFVGNKEYFDALADTCEDDETLSSLTRRLV